MLTTPAGHNISNKLVVTLLPNGTLTIREARRARDTAVSVDVATLYYRRLIIKSLNARKEKKQKKRAGILAPRKRKASLF